MRKKYGPLPNGSGTDILLDPCGPRGRLEAQASRPLITQLGESSVSLGVIHRPSELDVAAFEAFQLSGHVDHKARHPERAGRLPRGFIRRVDIGPPAIRILGSRAADATQPIPVGDSCVYREHIHLRSRSSPRGPVRSPGHRSKTSPLRAAARATTAVRAVTVNDRRVTFPSERAPQRRRQRGRGEPEPRARALSSRNTQCRDAPLAAARRSTGERYSITPGTQPTAYGKSTDTGGR